MQAEVAVEWKTAWTRYSPAGSFARRKRGRSPLSIHHDLAIGRKSLIADAEQRRSGRYADGRTRLDFEIATQDKQQATHPASPVIFGDGDLKAQVGGFGWLVKRVRPTAASATIRKTGTRERPFILCPSRRRETVPLSLACRYRPRN